MEHNRAWTEAGYWHPFTLRAAKGTVIEYHINNSLPRLIEENAFDEQLPVCKEDNDPAVFPDVFRGEVCWDCQGG